MNGFHSASLFCFFSRHHIRSNSVAPLSAYKHTHNPQLLHCSDKGLTPETSALKLFTLADLLYQIS